MPRIRAKLTEREEETARDLREFAGTGLLSIGNVADYFGVTRQTAAKWLRGVDAIAVGGSLRYQAADLARKIEAGRRRALP